MKTSLRTAAWAALAATLTAFVAPAIAHHSFAMFDYTRTVTFKGTVKEFQWNNPHAILWVYSDAAKEGEQPVLWSIELTSPGNLTRIGWTRKSFNSGDRVELEINPLRDGNNGGTFKKGTVLATGQVWISNQREAEKPGLQ